MLSLNDKNYISLRTMSKNISVDNLMKIYPIESQKVYYKINFNLVYKNE